MKRSDAGNAILPNTFQHPNIFIDDLMYLLTPEENVVLTFAVRRILGFQENISSRKDNISLSQFVDGIRSRKDNTVLSNGCGLGTTAVRSALENLARFKILLPTTERPDPRKGQEYWLQIDGNAIDYEGLETRKSELDEKARKQTQKARCAVEQQYAVEQQARGTVEQQARVLSDSNTKPTETQGNPPSGKKPKFSNPLWDMQHGKTPELTEESMENIKAEESYKSIAEKLEIGLRRGEFPQTPKAQIVYRWIAKKEKEGQTLDRFIQWAMRDEKSAAVSWIYHKDIELIKRDWMQAFPNSQNPDEKRPSSFYA